MLKLTPRDKDFIALGIIGVIVVSIIATNFLAFVSFLLAMSVLFVFVWAVFRVLEILLGDGMHAKVEQDNINIQKIYDLFGRKR